MASSFFEKLKKGIGIEAQAEPPAKTRKKRAPRPVFEAKSEISEIKEESKEDPEKIEKIAVAKNKKNQQWFEGPTGQLAVDVFQNETELVIQSAIAGIRLENLEISMEKDVIAIKGTREKPVETKEADYFTKECYWGPFSREIITPVEVDPDRAEASMKNGILVIRIPKTLREKKRKIEVKN